MSGRRESGPSDLALVVVIGIAITVGIAVWLWGGVAGLLFGSGWPRIGAGETFAVVVRLPGRIADPARAWPPGARSDLPGTIGLYEIGRAHV